MAYSTYDVGLYTDGIRSLGVNAVKQQSYDAGRMGKAPYAADCPTGSMPPDGVLTRAPVQHATTIPVVGSLGLAQAGTQAYQDTTAQTPVTAFDIQCCPNPPPCQEEIAWRARFKGCPPTYFADQPQLQCEVTPLGDRYWVADINPLLYERSIAQQAEPNPYSHMQARQLWMQFLMHDLVQVRDPYTRPISGLDQAYCSQLKTQGPPRFTQF